MLRPERVLVVILCLMMKGLEDIDSTVDQLSYQSQGLLNVGNTHDTHRRTIVKGRKTIPTKVVFHVPVETLLYEKSKMIIDKRSNRGLEMDLQMLYW